MNWTLIKNWAKDQGYEAFREKTKTPENPNQYDYYWGKIDDPSVSGVSFSVGKLATDIYNHMTNYVYVEYQESVRLETKDIEYDKLY